MINSYHLSLVHTSDGDWSGDGDGSTKSHTNPVKRRRNRRKQTLPFSSLPYPFYRVCMKCRASVSVSASVSVASVNQVCKVEREGWQKTTRRGKCYRCYSWILIETTPRLFPPRCAGNVTLSSSEKTLFSSRIGETILNDTIVPQVRAEVLFGIFINQSVASFRRTKTGWISSSWIFVCVLGRQFEFLWIWFYPC